MRTFALTIIAHNLIGLWQRLRNRSCKGQDLLLDGAPLPGASISLYLKARDGRPQAQR